MALDGGNPPRIMGVAMRRIAAPAELLPKVVLTDKEIGERVDHLIDVLVAQDQFSGVVCVARGEKPIYSRAAGLASRQWNVANRVDTKFNAGSITKEFTAVAVMQLVEAGKLRLEETLGEALPGYPDKEIGGKVTVEELLTHTSGISNPESATGEKLTAWILAHRDFKTLAEFLPKAGVDTLTSEPGTRFAYSNYGYMLLGMMIEKASGESYYDYVREHIFKAAGMGDTDNYELDREPGNLATGYMDAPGGRRSNMFMLTERGLPCGNTYSTAADLVKFSVALREHRLVGAEMLEKAWAGKLPYAHEDAKYGYGFAVGDYGGQKYVYHTGGWFGVTDDFEMIPGLEVTVVVLCNIDNAPIPLVGKVREWVVQGR
jgi:CubicO group peptidase (beta-lactamase class C family)